MPVQNPSPPSGGHVFLLAPNYDSAPQGTWAVNVQTAFVTNTQIYNDGTDGDNLLYKVYLPRGTWTLIMYGQTGTNRGISDIDIDNVEIASFDWYADPVVNIVRKSQTAIAIATSGLKTLRLRVDGKHASSTGYIIVFNYIALWRTA